MFKLNKKTVFILIVIIISAASFALFRSCSNNSPVAYEYDKVDSGTVEKTVSVSGKLGLYDQVIVRSAISGEISGVYSDFNARVKKGQLLLKIDSPAVDEAFRTYADTYRIAQMELESFRQKYKVTQQLYKEKLASKTELENARLAYQQKLANFRNVKNIYQERKENVKNKNMYSPISGIVIQKWVEEPMPVRAGTKMFLIAPTLKKMKLIINIDEADIGTVKTGQNVTFTVTAYPDKIFTGVIEQVRLNPVNNGGVVTYESVVICDNPEELLRPGMTATATVNVSKKENVLRVPNQALIVAPKEKQIKPGQKFVWVFDSSINDVIPMKRVEVKIGLVGDYYTEIIYGPLKENDQILVGIHNKILQ